MTKKARSLIFYTFLFLFIILAAGIILYAQGYSFDFESKSIVITGTFHFKSLPKDADIYINDKYIGKTNKFIKRLSPKKYHVKISKPEYYDWEKDLEIKSKLITEAKNVLLIKKNLTLGTVIEYNIKDYFISNDKQKIIYLTDGSTKDAKSPSSNLSLRLLDLSDNSDKQIYPDSKKLLDIIWSSDNKKVVLSFSNGYYVLDIKSGQLINLNKLVNTSIENPLFHPENNEKIYFVSKNKLFILDIPQKSFSPIVSDILAFSINDHDILYIYSDGSFYKTNLSGSSFSKIFDIPLIRSNNHEISIINDETIIIDNNLYFYNPQSQILKKIADSVKSVSFSEDKEKMLWTNHNSIGVIWLDTYEKEVIIKSSEEIQQAIWYSETNEHIIFIENGKTKIVELDSRDKRNIMDIVSLEDARIFYREKDDELYVFSENQLYKTRFNNK